MRRTCSVCVCVWLCSTRVVCGVCVVNVVFVCGVCLFVFVRCGVRGAFWRMCVMSVCVLCVRVVYVVCRLFGIRGVCVLCLGVLVFVCSVLCVVCCDSCVCL